jgi:hypothetical protein
MLYNYGTPWTFMVIKAKGSEKTTNPAVDISRYLTHKVMRPRKIETLLRKEKYEATCATLEHNLASNRMLTNAKIMKSHAFFRFTVAAKAAILPTPANV